MVEIMFLSTHDIQIISIFAKKFHTSLSGAEFLPWTVDSILYTTKILHEPSIGKLGKKLALTHRSVFASLSLEKTTQKFRDFSQLFNLNFRR